jgi:hypothetical protein
MVFYILEIDLFFIDCKPIIKILIYNYIKNISILIHKSSLRFINKYIELIPELGIEIIFNILRYITDKNITIYKCIIKILKNIYF